MDGKSYKIYLTKDPSAASLLCEALKAQAKDEESLTVGWGPAKGDHRIPEIYHEGDWFFAFAEYDAPENARPLYHLKIC